MKSPSSDYIAKEEAEERKPVELYHFWIPDVVDWYYSNSDVLITFDGNNYEPTALTRGTVEWDTQLNISKLTISIAHARLPVLQYIAQTPLDLVWVSVFRLFRDQDPLEAGVVFVGQIHDVSFQGVAAQANCVGFESYLDRLIPRYRYQKQCNWQLGDDNCTVPGNVQVGHISDVSDSGLIIEVGDISPEDDGYYALGRIECPMVSGELAVIDKRMITNYSGTEFTIRNKIEGLIIGAEVTVYPGCDGSIYTCHDRFDNLANFGGMPFIPATNPVFWT